MDPILNYIIIFCSYLLGSISSAILLCRLFKLPDPREFGSKNPGTTNALRIGGKKLAITVLLLDFSKGLLIPLAVEKISTSHTITIVACLALFLGQLFPIFFGFRGGKGIAVTIGIISAIYWQLALLLLLVWILIFVISKISSLSAIIATLSAVIAAFWLKDREFAIFLYIIGTLILLRHKQNIINLYHNRESKIIIK